MADNYLEDQYDRYLEKKAEWEKDRKRGKKNPVHTPIAMDVPSESKKEFEEKMDKEFEEDDDR